MAEVLGGVSVWVWRDAVLGVASDDALRAIAEASAPNIGSTDHPARSDRQHVRGVALDVLLAVASNPTATVERRWARFVLLEIATSPECAHLCSGFGDIPDDTWLDQDVPTRVVAAALATDTGLLDRLSRDRSAEVRARLAVRSDAPPAVLLRLAADEHARVSAHARETLKAL